MAVPRLGRIANFDDLDPLAVRVAQHDRVGVAAAAGKMRFEREEAADREADMDRAGRADVIEQRLGVLDDRGAVDRRRRCLAAGLSAQIIEEHAVTRRGQRIADGRCPHALVTAKRVEEDEGKPGI